jgi:hypothetical protein
MVRFFSPPYPSLTLLILIKNFKETTINENLNNEEIANLQSNDSTNQITTDDATTTTTVTKKTTTTTITSSTANSNSFYALIRLDVKNNESLLKKLLRISYEIETSDTIIADLVIQTAKNIITNENSTEQIVNETLQTSTTPTPLTTTITIEKSSESTTRLQQEDVSVVTTTQSTSIVSSGMFLTDIKPMPI